MWSSHTLRYVTHNYEISYLVRHGEQKLLCGTYTVVQDISRQSKYLPSLPDGAGMFLINTLCLLLFCTTTERVQEVKIMLWCDETEYIDQKITFGKSKGWYIWILTKFFATILVIAGLSQGRRALVKPTWRLTSLGESNWLCSLPE